MELTKKFIKNIYAKNIEGTGIICESGFQYSEKMSI